MSNPRSQPSGGSNSPNTTLTPQSSFTVTISMLSDWHIGCGAGIPGNIDRLVQRDKDNLPYIPAKTLTGIWRDACELVALGLDNGELDNEHDRPSWQKWVTYLFGDQPADPNRSQKRAEQFPHAAALSVRSAHFPQSLINALENKRELQTAITFTKPGISIDAASGCAKPDFLRFEEMARGGCTLTASCELQLPNSEEQSKAAYTLLLAGAKLVERIGGKRRRGAGKCSLKIQVNNKPEQLDPWLDWLEQHSDAPALPDDPNPESIGITGEQHAKLEDDWLQVRLDITALSPVIISQRTVGNVTESLDYVPGTYLLSLVSRKLGKLGVGLGRAIAHGDLLVTNATIAIDDQPGRPVPFALFAQKVGGGLDKGQVYNRLQEAQPEAQLKQIRGTYLGITTAETKTLPNSRKVAPVLETHNTIQDDVQRPTSDVGGVYSYEAIPAGTHLQAYLRVRQGLAGVLRQKDPNWWHQLNGRDRLGQSKKDDYGTVELKVAEEPPKPIAPEATLGSSSELVVWLLSDLLLRDERLRPTASIEEFCNQLGTELGVVLAQKKPTDKTLSVLARQNRRESWQVRWGLPRPSLVGLAAGSCIVFEIQGEFNRDNLAKKFAQVQAAGMGERCAEGYGQVAFNDALLMDKTSGLEGEQKTDKAQRVNQVPIKKGDAVLEYARTIETVAWRREIQRQVLHLASDQNSRRQVIGTTGTSSTDKPRMSQLGGLRSLLSKLEKPGDPLIRGWFGQEDSPDEQVKDKWKKRQEKWGGNLNEPYQLLTNSNKVWELLKLQTHHLIVTEGGEQALKDRLWVEAVRTLVDACIRAHKREQEPQSKENDLAGVGGN